MRPVPVLFAGALRALLLVATLFLGGALHELHHALEPHDGGAHSATEHACGCSTMHAAALVAGTQDLPAPASAPERSLAPASLAAPAVAPHAPGAPRAPPVA